VRAGIFSVQVKKSDVVFVKDSTDANAYEFQQVKKEPDCNKLFAWLSTNCADNVVVD
jgi:hypothetical protein